MCSLTITRDYPIVYITIPSIALIAFVVTECRLIEPNFDVTKIVTYDCFEIQRVCRIRAIEVVVMPLRSLVRLPYTNCKAL